MTNVLSLAAEKMVLGSIGVIWFITVYLYACSMM